MAKPGTLGAAQRSPEDRWTTIAFLRLIAWFVPPSYADLPHIRQHTNIVVGALLASGPVTLGLAAAAFVVVPPEYHLLPWAVVCTFGFALMPFLVKWLGRVDIVAGMVGQIIAIAVLVIAHFFGGLVSPALPWLMVALVATFYWLDPWPQWRIVNVLLFVVEVAIFLAVESSSAALTSPVSDRSLLIMLFCSSTAVFVFTQLVMVMLWSMNQTRQRQLRREVAARRATESELRVGREHFARAQAIGKVGSAETDLASNVTTWSAEHYRLLGLMPDTSGSVIDLLLAAVHEDDRDWVASLLDREASGDLTPAVEFRIVRPDGEVRWLRRQPQFVADAYGSPVSLFVTVQDITDWKHFQEERVYLERQLFQAQKLEAVGKLAGGVAHDFNNLLAIVWGHLELVKDEVADKPKLVSSLQTAMQAAERGAKLTDMMLSFARRQPLQPVEVDPAILLRDFGDMLRGAVGEAIVVKLTAEPDPWHCEIDPAQLQSAVLNLAVNAHDAMPNGGTLSIAIHNVQLDPVSAGLIPGAKPGDYVVIAVTDTGTGMSPEVAAHAFEPFFTTKDSGKGSGLGLSMVSGFVAQSGGHVEIASEPGRGTTVTLYLPRIEKGSARGRADTLPADKADRAKTILIVEDNDEVLAITALQLERMGYLVLTAVSGEAGIAMIKSHPEIDLLLSDLILPGGMDGVELAKRAIATRWDLKILFMSGYSTHTDLPDLGAIGVPRLLRKPFERAELAHEVRTALGG